MMKEARTFDIDTLHCLKHIKLTLNVKHFSGESNG